MHKVMVPVMCPTTTGDKLEMWNLYAADLEDEAIKFTDDDRVSIHSMIKEMEDYLEFEKHLKGTRTQGVLEGLEVIKHRIEVLKKVQHALDYVHVSKNYRRYYISFED